MAKICNPPATTSDQGIGSPGMRSEKNWIGGEGVAYSCAGLFSALPGGAANPYRGLHDADVGASRMGVSSQR